MIVKKNQNQNQKKERKFFYQNYFYLEKNVFQPRFETEQLVDLSIQYINSLFDDKAINILEIGCGSGVIALSLAMQNAKWKIDAIDISQNALNLSKKNHLLYSWTKIKWWKSNLFSKVDKKYNVIIANLPYVAVDFPLEKNLLKNNPSRSLFGGKQGMDIIKKFFQKVEKKLKKKYLIALEFGYDQKEMIQKLIKQYLSNNFFVFKKDYGNKNRFVFIYSK